MMQAATQLFPEASVDDLKMYLNGCLVLTQLKGESSPSLRLVEDFLYDNPHRSIQLRDYTEKKSLTVKLKEVLLDTWFPIDGWFNYHRTGIYGTRVPYRQNRKGICESTMLFQNVFSMWRTHAKTAIGARIAEPYTFHANPMETYQLVSQINVRFSFFGAAFARITEGDVLARALSPQFAMTQGLEDKHPSIWFKDIPAGKVVTSQRILVTEPLLMQEFRDFFTPQNLEVTL